MTLLDVDVFFDKSVDMLEERFPKRKIHLRTRIVWGMLSGALVLLTLTCCFMYYVQHEKHLIAHGGGDVPKVEDESSATLKKMKSIWLPMISFKPPATIIDAIEFFCAASKDYDNPRIPVEKRGVNFILKTTDGEIRFQGSNEAEDYSPLENGGSDDSSVYHPIPTITTSNITLYEALKLVCDSVECDFQIRGADVVVKTKSMAVEDLVVSFYKVKDAFLEMVLSWIEHDMKIPNTNSSRMWRIKRHMI